MLIGMVCCSFSQGTAQSRFIVETQKQSPDLSILQITVGHPAGSASDSISDNATIFFAIAPNQRVSAALRTIVSEPFSGESVRMSKSGLSSSPAVAVRGYFWYRNYYLARLELTGVVFGSSASLRSLSSVHVDVQINTFTAANLSPAAKNDGAFAPLLRQLIANYDEALPYQAQNWNDSTGGWFTSSGTYFKMGIGSDGVYRITYDDLLSLFPAAAAADPRLYQLFVNGTEIPVFVSGESDGQLNTGDYIEFPGLRNYTGRHRIIGGAMEEYNEYLNRYSDTTIAWFTIGKNFGKRLQSNAAPQPTTDTLRFYPAVQHLESDNLLYLGQDIVVQQLPWWTAGDFWSWSVLDGGNSVSIPCTISSLDPAGDSVRVSAKVSSWGSSGSEKAHDISVQLNTSADIGRQIFDHYQQAVVAGAVPVAAVSNGANTIRLVSNPTYATTNRILYDWFEIEYPQTLLVPNNKLVFDFHWLSSRTLRTVQLSGLTTTDIVLYKLGRTRAHINNFLLSAAAPYTLTFTDTIGPSDTYVLASTAGLLKPVMHTPKSFLGLRGNHDQTDYILLTHHSFRAAVDRYAAQIRSDRHATTRVFDVDDIFDEFGFGYPTPESMRDFLQSSTLWQQPTPAFVILIGDASYDYKFVYRDFKAINYVPSFGYPVSDAALSVWDSLSVIPQLYTGRIPINSPDELDTYAENVRRYGNTPNDEWNKRYLLFSGGDPTAGAQIENFRATNQLVADDYITPAPIAGDVHHFYKTRTPQSDFGPFSQQEIKDAISAGAVVISYIGHSGTQTWDNSIIEASQLNNTVGRYALVSDFGCSTAKFAEPIVRSFSEQFVLNPSANAIGYIGNSSLGFETIALTLPTEFARTVFHDSVQLIGEAHLRAKIAAAARMGQSQISQVMMLTNSLVGDPGIQLDIPWKPNLAIQTSMIAIPAGILLDDQSSAAVQIVVGNFGSVVQDSVTVLMEHIYNGTVIETKQLRRPIPYLYDTLSMVAAIKSYPGKHTIKVTIDPENHCIELTKQDNIASRDFVVGSSSLRPVWPQPFSLSRIKEIVILAPSGARPGSSLFEIEIDTTAAFQNPIRTTQSLTVPAIRVPFSDFLSSRRYFWRIRETGKSPGWLYGSFYNGSPESPRFGQNDSLSWLEDSLAQTSIISGGGVKLATISTTIRAISAGFLDGAFASLLINGINILPNTFSRGHNVVVLDPRTLQQLSYKRFDIISDAALNDSLVAFLNSIPDGMLVASIIGDEGAYNLNQASKNAYAAIGSKLISSIAYRDSWTIIGRKGAAVGTVPETLKKSGTGWAIADTTWTSLELSGIVKIKEIGPAARWLSLSTTKSVADSRDLGVTVTGIGKTSKQFVTADTSSSISLLQISSKMYPALQLSYDFHSADGTHASLLRSWELPYTPPAELVVDPNTLRLNRDSVKDGEYLDLTATIFNAGMARADSVTVVLHTDDKGSDRILRTYLLDSIKAGDSAVVAYHYNSRERRGSHHFSIEVDPDTSVVELYRFNNRAEIPFTILPDTLKPVLPNLVLKPDYISIPSGIIADDRDSIPVRIGILNTGSATNDSIDISARHEFGSSITGQWYLRIPMPLLSDTITVYPHIKNRAGDHLISATVDPGNKIVESSKSDNTASKIFAVATTTFRIVQPLPMNVSSVQQLILLNPSSEIPDGKKSIQIQIDTTNLFTTAAVMTAVMQEFTTSFPIGSLRRPARYWWRAKILGAASEWTIGTFYLGDSTTNLLGQVDSTGWVSNQFVHTAFNSVTGVQIQNTPGDVRAVSAGYMDGDFASIVFNGTALVTALGDTCHLLATLDSNFSVTALRRFHIFSNPAETDSLAAFLQQLTPGTILAAAISGEGSQNLTAPVRNLYKTLGSTLIDRVGWKDGWSLITRKGSGAAAEAYTAAGLGKAISDTVFYTVENSGSVTTALIGPASQWGMLKLKATIPAGSQLTTAVLPPPPATDTLLSSKNGTTLDLQSISPRQYSSLRLSFRLLSSPSGISPAVREWTINSRTSCELVLPASKVTLDKPLLQEGEIATLQAKVLNVAGVAADTVRVTISTDDAGALRIIQDITLPQIRGLDSVVVSVQYDSRGKAGSHSFVLRVDPDNHIPEFDKSNNSCTVPYVVVGDTIRPTLDVTYDGTRVLDGDYISARPMITFRLHDNNPTAMSLRDTANFIIRLDNKHIYFTPGDPIEFNPSGPTVRWNPPLSDGEHKFQYFAQDIAGNSTDTTLLYLNVSSAYKLLDVFPIPNPFAGGTHFSFTLLGASAPSSVRIRIFTIAGRAIRDLQIPAGDVRIGYNKVFWDGRDQDGSEIGNGIYLFRMMLEGEGGKLAVTGKLMKMR